MTPLERAAWFLAATFLALQTIGCQLGGMVLTPAKVVIERKTTTTEFLNIGNPITNLQGKPANGYPKPKPTIRRVTVVEQRAEAIGVGARGPNIDKLTIEPPAIDFTQATGGGLKVSGFKIKPEHGQTALYIMGGLAIIGGALALGVTLILSGVVLIGAATAFQQVEWLGGAVVLVVLIGGGVVLWYLRAGRRKAIALSAVVNGVDSMHDAAQVAVRRHVEQSEGRNPSIVRDEVRRAKKPPK
jgi:hypothetical protein